MTLVFFLDVYYCIIIAWTIFYLISTFVRIPELPWQDCSKYQSISLLPTTKHLWPMQVVCFAHNLFWLFVPVYLSFHLPVRLFAIDMFSSVPAVSADLLLGDLEEDCVGYYLCCYLLPYFFKYFARGYWTDGTDGSKRKQSPAKVYGVNFLWLQTTGGTRHPAILQAWTPPPVPTIRPLQWKSFGSKEKYCLQLLRICLFSNRRRASSTCLMGDRKQINIANIYLAAVVYTSIFSS